MGTNHSQALTQYVYAKRWHLLQCINPHESVTAICKDHPAESELAAK